MLLLLLKKRKKKKKKKRLPSTEPQRPTRCPRGLHRRIFAWISTGALLLVASTGSAEVVVTGKRLESLVEAPVSITDLSSIGSADSASPPAVCDPIETQEDYWLGGRIFDAVPRIDASGFARCRATSGAERLVKNLQFTAFSTGQTYGTCFATSIGDFVIADRFGYAKIGCSDNTVGIFEFEYDGATGGTVTEVLRTGAVFNNGNTLGDLQIGMDARWDGAKTVVGFRYIDTLGREGIGTATQGTPFTLEVGVRSDSLGGLFPRGVQLYYDCPEGAEPGEAGCAIPADLDIAFGVSTSAFSSIFELRDALGTYAAVSDPAPGFPGETFAGFLNNDPSNFAAGSRGTLFMGVTNAGNVGMWRWDQSTVDLVLGTGDPIPDTTGTVTSVERPSMDVSGFTFVANSNLVSELNGELRSIARVGVDVVNLRAPSIAELFQLRFGRRSFRAGIAAPSIETPGGLYSIPAIPVDRVRIGKPGDNNLYGSDVLEGVVDVSLRNSTGFQFYATAAPPGAFFRSASIETVDDLILGSAGSSWRFNRNSGVYNEILSGPFPSWQGLERTANDDVWATDDTSLYSLDGTTYAATFVTGLQDSGGGGITNLRGLALEPETGNLWGVRAGGELGTIDTSTGVFTQHYFAPLLPAEFWDSLAIDIGGLVYLGSANGRLAITSFEEGEGGPIPQLPISIVGDAGQNLSGLDLIVPEPGLGVGLAAGVLLLQGWARGGRVDRRAVLVRRPRAAG